MKKILILVDKINPSSILLADSINSELKKGDSCVLASFPEVFFHIKGDKVEATVKGINIKEFNVVHFRKTGKLFMAMAYSLAAILKKENIRLVNTAYETAGASGDKLTALVRLTLAGLPTIESFFVWNSSLKDFSKEIEETLGYPFVAKDRYAQRGRGVFLVKNKTQFNKIAKSKHQKPLIFQKFVKSKQEFRLLVLGDKVRVFEKKVSTDKNEFRANISLGSQEEFIPLSSMPPKMAKIAVKASKVLGLQVAGVDIMEDIEGNYWLLEVNRGPGITHDKSVSPELDQIGQFFASELLLS